MQHFFWTNKHCFFSSDGGLSHEPEASPSLSEFGGVSERSPLVVQTHSHPRASPSPPAILHDLQQSDSTSYVLLKGKEILNNHSLSIHKYLAQSDLDISPEKCLEFSLFRFTESKQIQ